MTPAQPNKKKAAQIPADVIEFVAKAIDPHIFKVRASRVAYFMAEGNTLEEANAVADKLEETENRTPESARQKAQAAITALIDKGWVRSEQGDDSTLLQIIQRPIQDEFIRVVTECGTIQTMPVAQTILDALRPYLTKQESVSPIEKGWKAEGETGDFDMEYAMRSPEHWRESYPEYIKWCKRSKAEGEAIDLEAGTRAICDTHQGTGTFDRVRPVYKFKEDTWWDLAALACAEVWGLKTNQPQTEQVKRDGEGGL